MYRANSCFVLMLDALLALFRYKGRPPVIAVPAASREDRFIRARSRVFEHGYESDRLNFPCFVWDAIDADVAILGMPNDSECRTTWARNTDPAPRRREGC